MLSFKSKILCLLFLLPLIANGGGFSDGECLNANFKTAVEHKGKPFGMSKSQLNLQKEGCVVTLNHEAMFMKKGWVLDVCRGPVHIKTQNDDVTKREAHCSVGGNSNFCGTLKKIQGILQDDGLIFASGEKEDLSSDHGKVYCAYILLNSYLGEGVVFSRHKQYPTSFIHREGKKIKATKVQAVAKPILPSEGKPNQAATYSDQQPSGVTDPSVSTGSF
ncbi:MAG: hypothetical protein HN509_03875 [Halobacteriovoraceae bacterium]|jgi:hypothetical protein|nr:hypothetical protein [Halobacteriovoraceae bacterium]MBT5093005.1 hypothetical protein [Halobacteriovoraceae bacterium]